MAADPGAARDLGVAVLRQATPLVLPLPGAGWLAATPLRARGRSLGVLVLHEAGRRRPRSTASCWRCSASRSGRGSRTLACTPSCAPRPPAPRCCAGSPPPRPRAATSPASCPRSPPRCQALQGFDRLACGFVNDTGDYIEMVSHPEGTSWGLGGVLPVVGSGPGFVALNNAPCCRWTWCTSTASSRTCGCSRRACVRMPCFPLTSRERTIGVLALGSGEGGAFDEAHPGPPAARRRRGGPRLRERAPLPEDAGAVDHRRGHAALQLPLLPPDPRPRAEARQPLRLHAVAALRGPRPLQADQRPVRPPARQPDAARGGLPDPGRRARDRHPRPLRRRRVRGDPAPDRRGLGAGARGEAAPPGRGAHLPAGGGDQRAARASRSGSRPTPRRRRPRKP